MYHDLNKGRLSFVYFCITLGFTIIILRLLFLVTFNQSVDLKRIYSINTPTKRGDIIDRNGVVLATDLDVKVLYANSTLIRNPELVSRKLSETLPTLSYDDLFKRLSRSKNLTKGWVLIKRNITPRQEKLVTDLGIAGLIFENSKVRVYPQKAALSHVVGYTDLDGNGLAGIEKSYDAFLKNGQGDKNNTLQLSLDLRIQDVLNYELENAIEKYKAFAAFGIVLDVRNGEILAMASLPSFDLNNQSEAGDTEKFNRASYGVYELGSVFKIFNHSLAFETKTARLTETYSVKDPIKFGRFSIDDDHKDKDVLTVAEIFSESSNIGSVKMAQNFSIEDQKKFLGKLGLFKKIDANFPSMGSPIIPRNWSKITQATVAFGHGIAVTPLHVVRSVGAIANDGKLFDVSFLKLAKTPNYQTVVSQETSDIMKILLRKVVLEGTGKNAEVEGYEVGGKTGTAERAEGGSYNKSKTLASFVGVFPVNNPRYAIFVGVDQPNYIFNTGGMVAAPVVGNVIRNIAPILTVRSNYVPPPPKELDIDKAKKD